MEPFPKPRKLKIGSLDNDKLTVEAHYNPKEIDLAKQVSWREHSYIRPRLDGKDEVERLDLEYTGLPPRTMSLELLFDGLEDDESIEPVIAQLNELASPRDEGSTDDQLARPHRCVVVWGDGELPRFDCVIEKLAVKYTMFSKTGRPLRALCKVELKELRTRTRRVERALTTMTANRKRRDDLNR